MNHRQYVVLFASILLSSGTLASAYSFSEAPSSSPLSDTDVTDMIVQITEPLVYEYHEGLMSFGARYTGSINCTLAAQYIFDEFEDMGLDSTFHEWKYDGFTSRNVVATLPGTDPSSNAIYIFSAHYDCTPGSLGADDDGSGVAAVMATAYVLSQYSFDHTIQFIAFSGEEVGTYGSFTYARDAYFRGDNIVAVINADMIGYANSTEGGKLIRFHQPDRAVWIAEYAALVGEKYLDLIDISVELRPNYIGADHQPFLDYGYDGVWIAHHDGYPWANSPEDNPDHLNWTYQTKATKFLCALVAELAFDPIDVQVVLTHPYEGYGYLFNRPILPLSLGRQWYKGLRGMTVILGRAVATADVYTQEDVEYVVFCLDDNFMFFDADPPYEWKIQGKHFPPIGKVTLKVYVYTTSGSVDTDEMDIRILTFSSQYGLW